MRVHKFAGIVLEESYGVVCTHVCLSGWNCGLFMMSSLGRMWMKTLFTHGAILCVCGDRKCTFSTTTVTAMLCDSLKRKKKMPISSLKEGSTSEV